MNKMQPINPFKYYLPVFIPHPTPRNCKKRHQKLHALQNLLLKYNVFNLFLNPYKMAYSLMPTSRLFQTEGQDYEPHMMIGLFFFVHGLKTENFLYPNYCNPDSWKNNLEYTQGIYVSCSGTQKLIPGSHESDQNLKHYT